MRQGQLVHSERAAAVTHSLSMWQMGGSGRRPESYFVFTPEDQAAFEPLGGLRLNPGISYGAHFIEVCYWRLQRSASSQTPAAAGAQLRRPHLSCIPNHDQTLSSWQFTRCLEMKTELLIGGSASRKKMCRGFRRGTVYPRFQFSFP